MPDGTNVVAIIGARGGSQGLLKKNIQMCAGKPLIAHTISAAKLAKNVDRVIVSTDDEEIAEVANRFGAEVPFIRPKEFATNTATAESVHKHAIEWLEENEGYKADIGIYLQCTDLFRKVEWIDEAVHRLLENPELDSVFVAFHDHKNFWEKGKEGYYRITKAVDKEGAYLPRQLKPPIFREDTGLVCATRVKWLKKGIRIGPKVGIIVNKDTASMIDIHTDFELWLADKVLTEWKWREKNNQKW